MVAEEPTVKGLALKVEVLEQKLSALSAQVELSNQLQQSARDSEFVIYVRADGRIEVEGKILSDAEVTKKIKSIAVQVPDQRLQIRASEETNYNHIMRLMDICKKAGISKVSLATTKNT